MAYEGWALVEQMGFRQTVCMVSECEQFGTKMMRLDVPFFTERENAPKLMEFTTRFAGGPSIYQVTPLDEETAVDMAMRQADPRPVKPTQYRMEDQRHAEQTRARHDEEAEGHYDGEDAAREPEMPF